MFTKKQIELIKTIIRYIEYPQSSINLKDIKHLVNEYPQFLFEGEAYRFLGTSEESPYFIKGKNISWTKIKKHEIFLESLLLNENKYCDYYKAQIKGLDIQKIIRHLPNEIKISNTVKKLIDKEQEIIAFQYNDLLFVKRVVF